MKRAIIIKKSHADKKSHNKQKEPSKSKRANIITTSHRDIMSRTIQCKKICTAIAMVQDNKSQKITF